MMKQKFSCIEYQQDKRSFADQQFLPFHYLLILTSSMRQSFNGKYEYAMITNNSTKKRPKLNYCSKYFLDKRRFEADKKKNIQSWLLI